MSPEIAEALAACPRCGQTEHETDTVRPPIRLTDAELRLIRRIRGLRNAPNRETLERQFRSLFHALSEVVFDGSPGDMLER